MNDSELDGTSRLDEIIADYLSRSIVGNIAERQALIADHPELVEELREFFNDHDRLKRLSAPQDVPTMVSGVGSIGTRELAGLPNDGTVRYFGNYELLSEIARGGMGVVYKARQASLGRTVALKMILAGHLWLGADPNNGVSGNRGYNWSPLQNAAFYLDSITAQNLVAAGANWNYEEKDCFTAIQYAVAEGHWDIVRLLYEAGAVHEEMDSYGKQPVDYAIAAGRQDMVELLTSKIYPLGYWAVETFATPLDTGDDGLPRNRWTQAYRSDRAEPAKWPFTSGVR